MSETTQDSDALLGMFRKSLMDIPKKVYVLSWVHYTKHGENINIQGTISYFLNLQAD